jgi:hypothetical protein
MVLPSAGAIFAGVATTGSGIAVMTGEAVTPDKLLSDSNSIADHYLGGQGQGNGDGRWYVASACRILCRVLKYSLDTNRANVNGNYFVFNTEMVY